MIRPVPPKSPLPGATELRSAAPSAPRRALNAIGVLVLAVVISACGDDDPFGGPQQPVTEATVRVHSLNGSEPGAPNSLALIAAVGTGRLVPLAMPVSPNFFFDLAVDFEEGGTVRMYPVDLVGSVLGGAREVGIRSYSIPFDELTSAPTEGYTFSEPVELAEGNVFAVVAANAPICLTGFVLIPNIYAKLRVEEIDHATRTVVFHVVADASCGFRRLTVGGDS